MRDYDDILMHYEEPYHRGHVSNPTHVHEEHNPACGDWIKYQLIVVDGCVNEAWFDGGGCVISQSAASILTEYIEGKACHAAGNVLNTLRRKRYHNATGTGALKGPTGVQPKARVTYTASWPDAMGRPQADADYGINGGIDLSRPNTIPSHSDTVLVNSSEYDSAGKVSTRTNPGGVTNCSFYDSAGRQVKQVMNCTGGSSSSSRSSSSSSSGGNDDAASRVASIVDDDAGSTHLADYSYLGLQTFVGVDYTEPDISESTGPSWVTPVYSKAGNMTTIPQPADPTKSYTATYDAWNRLVKIVDGSDTVAAYEHDGAKRRTIRKSYSGGMLDETRHLYFTEPRKWQVIEERVDSSGDADRQFVWGLRYVDDLILRERDTTANGSLDEQLYGMQDANWNVTALADPQTAVQERFAYAPYGSLTVLTPSFGMRSDSSYDWETTYAGNRLDSTGFYQIRRRSYLSNFGWIQRDPAKYENGASLYQYCLGNPTSHVDPTGLWPIKYQKDFCSIVLSDCLGNGLSCLCGALDWVGAVPGFVAGALNCLCELWDLGTSLCQDLHLIKLMSNEKLLAWQNVRAGYRPTTA